MPWSVVLAYAVLAPVAGVVLGSAIRVRELERPQIAEVAPEPAPSSEPLTPLDVRAVRSFTGRTPRSLRPAWQQRTLRTLGL